MRTSLKKCVAPLSALIATLTANLLLAPTAWAAKLKDIGAKAGYKTADVTGNSLAQTIGTIIGYALALLGVVFTALVIYAGFLWMTAQGNEEQVTKAKKMMTNAVIGIIIVGLAQVISAFVFSSLTSVA